ncbi:hypothetical protein ACRAWD_07840 [Caulobacter segnis]
MHTLQTACDTGDYELYRRWSNGLARAEADSAARPTGLALGPQPDRHRRRRERQRDPQALRDARHEPRGPLSPEAHGRPGTPP